MTDQLNFPDDGKPVIPQGINVLTILTFIGSGIGFLFLLAAPMLYKFLSSMMDKALTSGAELSAKQMAEIEKGRAAMAIAQANMVPTIVVGLAGVVLCVWGAMWMRKLRKDGYWVYVAGEVLPVIANFILMGTSQMTGVMAFLLGLILPGLFIVLYSLQRKHLVN
jgi:ABC-type spermidine/putrescine transport system permease subunit II